ncbi:formate dehydrogenase accessory sulfurtransferase FdhD [Hyphomicrobium sp. xq]|uniref:Formate dehydrogenase accessory sulfurtransferase FdhD n=1 Tax=Hyphomicrobium album TaxID=2665159 RepID=A0A6I3KJM6_9HYPH|nr:formate dehydrogenase accessory sulfurtransferase FdhD [Hyphomicrobium album]MTD93957.1 formate dehydrogenase accessory sulfurtransferase FdhD [Hyphomicrobium album]
MSATAKIAETELAEARDASPALCSVPADGVSIDSAGKETPVTWQLPEEVPVALLINSEPYTVMMATPANLTDFGRGFVLAEGVLQNRSDILGIIAMPVENGWAIDVAVDEEALAEARMPRRTIEGRSGCGLCGVERIDDVVRVTEPVAHTVRPAPEAMLKAARELPKRQIMNRFNRTVHGAAWATLGGEIVHVREDVGRHNALDKLIGVLADTGTDLATGFVVMTSRCSFELVQKSVTFGIGALVTVSAPTALALDIARKARLFVASLAGDGVVVLNS